MCPGEDGAVHMIFGGSPARLYVRPAYAKFMIASNYTYLKLKILGHNGIITIGTTYQCAFKCH
jgi:hypothetical protein